jgi:hypothetical protein
VLPASVRRRRREELRSVLTTEMIRILILILIMDRQQDRQQAIRLLNLAFMKNWLGEAEVRNRKREKAHTKVAICTPHISGTANLRTNVHPI